TALTLKPRIPERGLYYPHVVHRPFPLERNARPPSGSLAQPIHQVAPGNLHRPQDGKDRPSANLRNPVARVSPDVPLPAVDCPDGQLRPRQASQPFVHPGLGLTKESKPMIQLKRAYDPPAGTDGVRY